jgi:nicotinate-nucleotide adenylyltransferase
LKLGVFGGAFDPPHCAHVALARAAVAQLQLDQLRIFPTGQAWHKARALSPAADRLAMAQLAFADVPGAVIDDREIRREGPTYTVDTLRELAAEHPGAQLQLIMGEDQAGAFTTWREWRAIAALATLAVAGRPSQPAPTAVPLPADVRVAHIALAPMSVSATDIRRRAAAGQGIDRLVPDAVARYIDRQHLYRPA